MNKSVLSLIFLFVYSPINAQQLIDQEGAVIRSDTLEANIYLCFTGHDYVDGFTHVLRVLEKHRIHGSFFLTGDFVRNHGDLAERIADAGHFIGAHSDKHLLYCAWENRDSLLHSPQEISQDIADNLKVLKGLGISPSYFMPPYEWYNEEVVEIAEQLGQVTVNFSPGTRSNADYTTPDLPYYIGSKEILASIYEYEESEGMNGFHLLIHPGVSPKRKDKLYLHLDDLIIWLKERDYQFSRF